MRGVFIKTRQLVVQICIVTLIILLQFNSSLGAKQKITVKCWTFGARIENYEKTLAPSFTKEHPNVRISISRFPLSDLMDKIRIVARVGTGGPDIFDACPGGLFLEKPLEDIPLVDLTPYIKANNYYEKAVPGLFELAGMKDGKFFYVPWESPSAILLYRRDLLEEAGFPSKPEEVADLLDTWSHFVDVGKKLTKDTTGNGKIDRYMIALNATNLVEAQEFQAISLIGGGLWFNEYGQPTLDSEPVVQSLRFYIDLIKKFKVANEIGVFDKSPIRFESWRRNAVVTKIAYDYYFAWVADAVPEMKGKWGGIPLPAVWPGGPRGVSYYMIGAAGILKQSKHPDVAWKWMEYIMLNPESLARRFKEKLMSQIPPVKEVLAQPMFSEYNPFFKQRIEKLAIDQSMEAPTLYGSPYASRALEELKVAIYYTYSGKWTPKEALRKANENVLKAMRR